MPDATTSLAGRIATAPETDPGMDQQQLFALGLEHVRALAGRVWTDHNLHDPGITALELLCYALTDLSYRASFPLEDLLAAESDNPVHMASQFFTAREILPNDALTGLDYRKLLIDRHPEVRNAWLEPAPLRYYADTARRELRHDDPGTAGIRPVDVRGLYTVRVAFSEDLAPAGQPGVVEALRQTLRSHRNLSEDFVDIIPVETQAFALCAEIELALDADPADVAARLLAAVQEYFDPPVRRYSLEEMRARKHADGSPWTVAEIFAGPKLEHGFIDDEELALAELREDIYLSDVIGLVMDLPGVLAVREALVNPTDAGGQPLPPADKWHLRVAPGRQPRLTDQSGRLVFHKKNLPVLAVNLAAMPPSVAERLAALRAAARARLEALAPEDLPIPQGRFRAPAAFHSVQNDFPALYGVGPQGLPASADEARQAQALQLKAYLLFFDQAMANYLAQLAKAWHLLAAKPPDGQAPDRSYFAQVVSLPGHAKIYAPGTNADALSSLLETAGEAEARLGRFLDHLLARCAEDFHQYSRVMRDAFGGGLVEDNATKRRFLRELPAVGAERARAYDYTGAPWDTDENIPGAERRIAGLLGFKPGRRDLGSLPDNFAEVYKDGAQKFRFRVWDARTLQILFVGAPAYLAEDQARAAMMRAIYQAQLATGCRRNKPDGTRRFYFDIPDPMGQGEALAVGKADYADAAALEAAIEQAAAYLQGRYPGGEGLYLIENLLLRPELADDPFLPICVDPACADDDPYSYRLHLILPAYAGRFANMDFRRFAEETLRAELPAHLLPKVCWIGLAEMVEFQAAYRAWVELRTGVGAHDRAATLGNLRRLLYEVKNVHPSHRLLDCTAGEVDERPHFILDRTVLGSAGTAGETKT